MYATRAEDGLRKSIAELVSSSLGRFLGCVQFACVASLLSLGNQGRAVSHRQT